MRIDWSEVGSTLRRRRRRRSPGGSARSLRKSFAVLALVAGAGIGSAAIASGETAAPAPAGGLGWGWFKTDTHVHSAFSGDASPDLGILSNSAKAAGYNAIFLTDHNLASSFPVSIQTANDVKLDDTMPRWFAITGGTPTSVTNALVGAPAPIDSGTKSLHLAASASTAGEAAVWTKRGANLRSGDDVLNFAVNPKTLSGSSGLYVSASLGGDPTISPPPGYTTSAGVISPAKSKVFIYYLGAPPPASRYPGSQLFTFNLAAAPQIAGHFSCDRPGVVLNAWTHCTINLTKAVALIAQAERPLDYNGFGDLKLAAAANGGTADAFFDAYRLTATAPEPAAQEYVRRNALVSQYSTPSFRIHPGVEMGVSDHTNRFDFGFSDPAAFRSYTNGTEGIAETHAGGYPAQLDHPGVNGGVTDQEAIDNDAYGADLMETRFQNMIDDWDAILSRGVVLLGAWSTDNHQGRWSGGSQATYIQAPSVGFDDLMRSLYEGRAYLATSNFAGRVIFNRDPASTDPHPARYPVFVSSAQTTASAHLAITAGIGAGSKVVWITNGGATLATEPASGTSYDAVRTFPIGSTPFTYVRAELLNASGIQTAMTQPIAFRRVSGLPNGMSFGAVGVATPNGRGYTNVATRAITAASWNGAARSLSMTLANPASSLVEIAAATAGLPPSGVTVDGSSIPRAGDRQAYDAATGSSWYFDGTAGALRVKARQGSGDTLVVVSFAAADGQAPTVPAGLSASAASPNRVDLSWSASTDNVGVAGYTVSRNGAALATVTATSYADAAGAPSTTYSYAVEAIDAAGNRSAPSASASATTPGLATLTVIPDADAYTSSDAAATNYGGSTSLRLDASPLIRGWLRFTVSGLGGAVSRATLRLYAPNAHAVGYDVSRVTDTTWSERLINHGNAPAVGARIGSSGAIAAGAWTSVDVTPYVTGNGAYSVALSTTSNTALSLASRESGANAPQLVVESSVGAAPDTKAPTTPGALGASAVGPNRVDLSWTASSDDVGVTGYEISRNGAPLASVGGGATAYSDTAAAPATGYSYTVAALDAAGNRSASSAPASATTPAAAAEPITLAPTADAYVSGGSAGSNYGGATSLRVDASPDTRSYLRFSVSGLSGPPTQATLRVYANSSHSRGYEVRPVAGGGWTETGITFASAPAMGASLAASGATGAGAWTSVDVTSLIAGNGTYDLALTTASDTALSLASREAGANAPQLVITG